MRGQGPTLGPGLALWVLAVALGVLALPRMPALPWWLAAGAIGLLALRGRPWVRWLGAGLLAAAWTGTVAVCALDARWAGGDPARIHMLEVEVRGLPRPAPGYTRFLARVTAAGDEASRLLGKTVQVTWYAEDPLPVQPGERWRLPLRLRRPGGLRNPGGFDFERHALVHRIAAVAIGSGPGERTGAAGGIDLARGRIAARIGQVTGTSASLLRGLAVGDTSALGDADWDRLRRVGLSHLLAISGLHLGIVAGLAALLVRLGFRLVPGLGLRWPRPQAAALAALLAASGYALLSGLGLPTLRSLCMLAVALAGVLLRRRNPGGTSLALAALVLWALDPLALLTPGYWLSLAGVFWLLACVPRGEGLRHAAFSLARAQLVLGLALAPLSVLYFGGLSLAGFLLNLIAVPWVTLVVVPSLLVGVVLLPWPVLAEPCLRLAARAVHWIWDLAGLAADLPWAYLHLPEPTGWTVLLAALGCIVLLAPRGMPGRMLGGLLLLPLLWPAPSAIAPGAVRIDLLDVGQGLAVLVRTRGHALLYDTAARSRFGFDAGEAVVLPALRALGVRRLDRILVSHGDADHAGGLEALRRAFPQARVASGEPGRLGVAACRAGEAWDWDGVGFRLLHPPVHFPELGNQSSCVLQVATAGGRALIPGDIDRLIEQRLVREQAEALRANLLVVPHHGSASSSDEAFIAAVAPRWAAVSVGEGNRFGHPRPEVVARYRARGAELLSTAETGRIAWVLDAAGGRIELVERRDRRRFWDARSP